MIINGNPAGSVGFWSKHLLRDDTNEKAEVKEISGLSATDLKGALKEMQGVASGSRCQGNFMYQANINILANEKLTPEQWREAIDTLEKNLGLEGHQRVVVEHIKKGRQHFHIVWNRVDAETMKVADMGGNYIIHEKTSRELERRFDLSPTKTSSPENREKPFELWEMRAAERSGISLAAMKQQLTELWRTTDSGAAFKAAIEERGFVLAKGDRRDFCIVDRAGDAHSLARRLDGVKAAAVRARMSDIDRDALPTVQEARELQRSRPPSPSQRKDSEQQSRAPKDQSINDFANAGIGVVNIVAGGVEKLADFVCNLLDGGSVASNSRPHEDHVDRLIANRKAEAALENIRDRLERGKGLTPEDVMSLSREHLENIRVKGDSYLYEIIYRLDEDRERERDWQRGRPREL